ncbi:GuaB1 family IMP dehydrogenase-related protein [Rothia uropygialis]|uniref:GuaB1 family IMP dehydrogenase-related protein n=1 Tax=Kocuria sp. 36 TaxID=1415402 RepID=UPI00101CFA7D|nr:GuaB1 family IMP dehydrogenase-related protein [Kocuria sp. 36]
MRFLNTPSTDLTYNDVFLVPSRSEVASRFDVDLSTEDGTGTTIPVVAANMTAVAGARMMETLARRGAMAILPQDVPLDAARRIIEEVKGASPLVESAVIVSPDTSIEYALRRLGDRRFGEAVVVDEEGRPVGVVRREEGQHEDPAAPVEKVMHPLPLVIDEADLAPEAPWRSEERTIAMRSVFAQCEELGIELAVVVRDGRYAGVLSHSGAVRGTTYQPALDDSGALIAGAAVGINGDVLGKARALLDAGADVLVVDTAHGHQQKMFEALAAVKSLNPRVPIVAGNVVSADGTRDLIEAGADIIKVGVGPGAMCTTRMMTAVGRPQFSAVLECAAAARELGKHVWADGGVKYPRDVALALAAGASQVMVGSWLAGTYESPGELHHDDEGRLYKESFGMASTRAVKHRTRQEDPFTRARKAMFEEGISNSTMYLDAESPSAEDVLDKITAGLRSSLTYAGSNDLAAFHERAVVGIQAASGYDEGRARSRSWLV